MVGFSEYKDSYINEFKMSGRRYYPEMKGNTPQKIRIFENLIEKKFISSNPYIQFIQPDESLSKQKTNEIYTQIFKIYTIRIGV